MLLHNFNIIKINDDEIKKNSNYGQVKVTS